MMKYYTVDILTPSKIIAKGIPAESLLIPTVRGQINVLENHTHIVTKLSTGVLTVFGGPDYADRNFIVSSGVCKILEEKGYLQSQSKKGKLGFRVYPSWDKTENKQAQRTQNWQLNYFIETPISILKIKTLYSENL